MSKIDLKTRYISIQNRPLDIGQVIRRFRRNLDLSQEYVALQLEVSQNMLSKIERGQAKVTFDHICKLSDTFNIEPQAFFDAVEEC